MTRRKKTPDPTDADAAKTYAARLLAGRDYARAELAVKLTQRGFTDEVVARTLDTLAGYGYIVETGDNTDLLDRMAREYVGRKKNPASAWALRSTEQFLLKKGFEPHLVREWCVRFLEEASARDTSS